MSRIGWLVLGLLFSSAASAAPLDVVGTWSIVVSIESSTCAPLEGTEIARQWNISKKPDGTFFAEFTNRGPSKGEAPLPLTGKAEGDVLELRGGVVSAVDGSDSMVNLALWELKPVGDRLTGSFLGSVPGKTKEVSGHMNAHVVCAIAGSVRGSRS